MLLTAILRRVHAEGAEGPDIRRFALQDDLYRRGSVASLLATRPRLVTALRDFGALESRATKSWAVLPAGPAPPLASAAAALEAEFGAEAAAPAAAGAGMGEVSLGPVGDSSLTGGADGSAGPLGESFALGDGSFAANTSLGASLCASLNVSLGPSETSATEAPGTLAALAAAKSPEPAMSKKQLAALKRGAAKKAAQLKEQTLAKQNEYFAEVDQWELEELEEDDAVVA